MTGLAIGVSNMKSGERALLHVGWELGYGKEGSFSFPNVPPMADILYEVELIGFDETKEVSFSFMIFQSFFIAVFCLNFIVCELIIEFNIWTYKQRMLQGKARGDMTVEERIGAADRRKMDGNVYFKEEKLEEAMQQYEMVTYLLLSQYWCLSLCRFSSSWQSPIF